MATQDWKSIFLTTALIYLTARYFVFAPTQNHKFEISSSHITYHQNWTSSVNQMSNLQSFKESLKLDAITHLDVSFSMSELNESTIRSILTHKFKTYKSIRINLANNPIGTSGADYILSLIPNGVEELDLAFDSIEADKHLGQLMVKRLNNLNSVKKLKISLILSVSDQYILEHYLRFSRPSPKLEEYSLILIGNNIKNSSLTNLKSHLARTELKVLDLNFYANKLQASGAQLVAQAIKTQKKLESLNLDFYFNNITETGTENICKAVQEINHSGLKSLGLNFDFNYINNDGGKAIGKLLPELQNLQSLQIGVASKNFGYLGFKHVTNGIKTLVYLRKLVFRCGINRVGFNGAQITKNMLSHLINLETLDLDFFQNYVGDDGLTSISSQIAEMKQLKNLNINFGFNDAKSFGLVRSLQHLSKKQYNSLYLSFSSNQFKDTDVSLSKNYLIKLIRNTKQLELEFMETAISKKMRDSLENLFERQNAIIYVNSIISEQEQKKYQERSQPITTEQKKDQKQPSVQTKKPQSSSQL